MLISYNWLKKFVNIPSSITPEKLGELLTLSTVEVESIKKQAEFLDKVVVGELLEIKKHPKADKLSIAKVDVGEKKPRQIIFGQIVKLKPGLRVPVALAPAKLPHDVKIKKTNLRGEKSEGMLCLDQELGLLQEGVSIQFFSKDIPAGTPITKALKLDDVIIEIENKSLTNRPDLWSHYGMAREVAALTSLSLKPLSKTPSKVEEKPPSSQASSEDKLEVEIKDNEKCRRYVGVILDNIKIEPSPDWLARQLEAVGVRSINNIVDITNYVMLEIGEPMHAFDWRDIKEGKIIVETAKQGERFTTLDGQVRKLDKEMLLVKDAIKGVALAGVMGGLNSEVREDTTKILFEAANFDATNIRRTSTKLGLRTEGSMRWEKSLDPEYAELAMKRAVELTLELCPGAKVTSPIIDIGTYKPKKHVITLDLDHLNRMVGEDIPAQKVIEILKSLEFKTNQQSNNLPRRPLRQIEARVKAGRTIEQLKVEVPSFRATRDITIPEDLIEEIARIYGYGNVKPEMPKVKLKVPQVNTERQLERQVKNILTTGFGFNEVQNYSFVAPKIAALFDYKEQDLIALDNPVTPEQSHLRPNLFINLAKNIKDNLRFFNEFKLFEIGRVFTKEKGSFNTSVNSKEMLPSQDKYLSGVVVGDNVFEQAKASVENLLEQLEIDYQLVPSKEKPNWADWDRTLEVKSNGKTLGYVAEICPRLPAKLKIKSQVGIFNLNFTQLANVPKSKVKEFSELPIYPSITRDLAIIVSQGIIYATIAKAINATSPLIIEVNLFDVYTGKNIGQGKRSLAFHIIFQAPDKTLESEEVDGIFEQVVKKLEEKFGAKIRK